jgi:hypothetical protein
MSRGLPDVPPSCDHREARARLEEQGWRWHAHGDWAHVHVSPDGSRVARVAPFDPAHALHVDTCLAHPEVAWFQRIDWRAPLAPAGEIVVMERLEPAEREAASRLCCQLGRTNHLGREPSPGELATWQAEREADPGLQRLHGILAETAASGARRLGWWGGLDVRPGNVMQDASGQLKLLDSCFVAGRELIAALLRDAEAVARCYSTAELRGFLEIAAFDDEREQPGTTLLELRARVEMLERKQGR